MVIINNNNQPVSAFPLTVTPTSPGSSSPHPAAQGAPLQGQECPVPARAVLPSHGDSSHILACPAAKSGLNSASESLTLSKWNTGGRWVCAFELGFDLTQQNPKTQKQAQCKQCLAAPQRKQAQTGFPELWKAGPDSHMGMKGSRKRKHGEHHPDFEIPKSSLSPKGTKKAQSLPKSQGCSQILGWPCTQALQGSAPGLCSLSSQHRDTLMLIISNTGLPRPFLSCGSFLHQSVVTISSSLCNSLYSWVIKQNFLTELWRPFHPTCPPSPHPNAAFPGG